MVKDRLAEFWSDMGKDPKKRIWILAIVALIGVLVIFATYYLPESFSVAEGEVSPETIEAHQTITFEDTQKTEASRKAAAEKVGDIYVFDSTVIERQTAQISQLFKAWEDLLLLPEEERPAKAETYIGQFGIKKETAAAIAALDSITLQAIKSQAVEILAEQWRKGIRAGEVETARKSILDKVYLQVNESEYVAFIQAIYRIMDLEPNYIFDEAATKTAKEEAGQKEAPVLTTVYRNQKIIGKGEVVTANHIATLKALGYQRSKEPYIMILGIGLFTLGIFYMFRLFLLQFKLKTLEKENQLQLLVLLFLTMLALARLIISIDISAEASISEMIAYLIPVSAVAMLAAILLDKRLGMLFSFVVSLYLGFLCDGNVTYSAVSFLGSMAGIYGVSRFSQRTDWVKSALTIALMNTWVIISLALVSNSSWPMILWGVTMGCLNGFISPILAYGSLPFLESSFKITTSISLMELGNPSQPLLKELLIKAPGTYNHSILVGNLAESAADTVGADPILVRVGAYYHDIGKLRRPYFFIENQFRESNPHDKLTPSLSALILSAHVKDGIELGKKYKLPQKVMDFIAQHHGTSIMGYFYHKAMEEPGNLEKVQESDFRYPGPKPQNKETALVMLADSVEAAVRSMHVTGDKLEFAVKKIIQDKLQDGQLEDSNLTLSDLKHITAAFTQVLIGIYHSRIEYPEIVLQAMKEGMGENETDHQQPAEPGNDNPGTEGYFEDCS
ncbi:MAG TPA: phosphohydrolase [Peptococcaceae bacterium]|nr:phosphohydrolase [Peptococcaceae bacterium]